MNFDDYLNHEEFYIENAAGWLNLWHEMYNEGLLTESELKELREDMLDLARIDEYSDEIENRVLVEQALKAIMQISLALVP